jgi:alcohol dehydrogenase (cytochrome c)
LKTTLGLGSLALASLIVLAQRPASAPLTYERLLNAQAEPQNWLMYWGNYQGTHYSSLKQIDKTNVDRLQTAWMMPMSGMANLQATPLVVDGVMYTSGVPGTVYAIDARTGAQIWKYERAQKTRNPDASNPFNRGVAVMGNRVFAGTLDAALVALDRTTGLLLWETQVADTMVGYSITQSPLVVKDKIIVGVAGGEFGIRGFIDAYDLESGKRIWRFNTIPGPGEFGNDTWKGDSWMRGGGSTWLTGTYDADLDTLYWPVGNPGPDIDGSVRLGDNCFRVPSSRSDPNTGRRKWHYQFTPGDTHDWDSTEDMVLDRSTFQGQARKLLLHADRNGFLYVLDRTNGKFLKATAFVKQTWNAGFDENGRPKFVDGLACRAPKEAFAVFPSPARRNRISSPLLMIRQRAGSFSNTRNRASAISLRLRNTRQANSIRGEGRLAWRMNPRREAFAHSNPETGKVEWETRLARGSLNNGLIATGGGIVFASSADGNLQVLDSKTGTLLRSIKLANGMASAPMSYAVNGKQFVGVMAGSTLYALSLPE